MTDMHTVRASGPADLLALVPGLLGFHPEDSVVADHRRRRAAPFHARVDLPDDPVGLEELADYLTRVAHRNGVRTLAASSSTPRTPRWPRRWCTTWRPGCSR